MLSNFGTYACIVKAVLFSLTISDVFRGLIIISYICHSKLNVVFIVTSMRQLLARCPLIRCVVLSKLLLSVWGIES